MVKFFDVKTKKSFDTDKFSKETKIVNGRGGKRKITFALATRNGRKVYRILSNEKV